MQALACIAVLLPYGTQGKLASALEWAANNGIRNPTGENPGSSFDTSNIQSILARAQDDSPDVLLIYDCCHSLYAHPTNRNSGRAIVECLFAGGFEAKVPIAGPDSFTAALIDELCEAIHSPTPPSVSDLHRGIIDRLQRWKARGIFGSDDAIIKDRITGKVVLTKAVRTTPVHMFLSVNDAPRTIILAPRKQCASEDSELEAIGKSTTTISQSSALPRVLLAVRIVDDEKNTEALKNWLLSAPAEVVVFEKIYQSYSELFLVELPVSVWNMLPRSPAVSFIGFTMGEKALPRLDGSQMTSSIPLQEYQASADITKHSRVHSITQDDEGQQPGIRGNSTDQGHSDSSSLAAIAHPDLQMHHPGSEEDKALVVVLNVADRTLSNAFARLDKTRIEMQIRDDTILTDVLHQVRLLKTAEGMRLVSESDIQKHRVSWWLVN
ncbi:hypothetical protein B0I35DRAFT_113432 [Stachybotrys elegans]|uniref:Uncharacterized protein n=1 Tax=Stachybotrys elegans TaxID=80388 RepID=A0A8K0WKD2_9HYPO|nr:hypothetical protein B0I35DRAFT_113432 [Stachybotrys elegans]